MKAIIFDLFETLITEWGHEKYTKRLMCDDIDIPYNQFNELWESHEYPRYRGEYSCEESLNYVLAKAGKRISEELLSKILKKRYDTKSACFNYLNPDIIPMLQKLKDSGYLIGLISNCSSEEVTIFKKSSIYPFFDAVILSYEVGMTKPEASIYLECLQRLNCSTEECLYVGDGGSHELEGADKLGMKAVQALWYKNVYDNNAKNNFGFDYAEAPYEIFNYL